MVRVDAFQLVENAVELELDAKHSHVVVDPFAATNLDIVNRAFDHLSCLMAERIRGDDGLYDHLRSDRVKTELRTATLDLLDDEVDFRVHVEEKQTLEWVAQSHNFGCAMFCIVDYYVYNNPTPYEVHKELRDKLEDLNDYLRSVWHQGNIRTPESLSHDNIRDVLFTMTRVAQLLDHSATSPHRAAIHAIVDNLGNYRKFRHRARQLSKHGRCPPEALVRQSLRVVEQLKRLMDRGRGAGAACVCVSNSSSAAASTPNQCQCDALKLLIRSYTSKLVRSSSSSCSTSKSSSSSLLRVLAREQRVAGGVAAHAPVEVHNLFALLGEEDGDDEEEEVVG
jgi:hypothetical protein